MPTIRSIHIYPIKGMRGISLPSAQLQPEGFVSDRRWMLVDDDGTFISQRTHPEMTMFIPSISRGILTVASKGEEITIPTEELTEDHIDVRVFDDNMKATVVSDEVSKWFSERLHTSLRLVKVSQVTNRIKDFSKYVVAEPKETVVSFADGYPYLILGTASMDLLNSKMEVDLDIDRFRANIVVDTDQPHDEDIWKSIQIGDQQMIVIKPCARCQVPTIDQQTGEMGKQPNTALATYRRDGRKVNFGMNAVALTNGSVSVGDTIVVMD